MTVPSSSSKSLTNETFIAWFKSQGGNIHSAVGLTTFPSMGRGAVALQDLKKGTILFTLPRSLTLSMQTSSLPSKFGEQAWKKFKMHEGWVGLILCMLWEAAAGNDGKWGVYLSSLPDSFPTPMFWSELDLQELEGTATFDKIGKVEAEKDYHQKIIPAIESRPDLFPTESVNSHYSLHRYHTMGSLILSRSFHVERWSDKIHDNNDHERSPGHAAHNSDTMDVDPTEPEADDGIPGACKDPEDEESDEDSDSDSEDPAEVAMVPMADMLNARYRSENAKLCYESEDLQMISTQDISAGEQIWNTYGDLPNSELLRRYGHVDLFPLPGGGEGNPADVVDIRADLVLDVLHQQINKNPDSPFSERIEWWLEEGGDELSVIFAIALLAYSAKTLISLIRLLAMTTADWEKTREKGKIPKPRPDSDVLRVVDSVLEMRLGTYRTSIEEDEALLSTTHEIGSNKRMAAVVRLGEKRILIGALNALRNKLAGEVNDKRNERKDVGDVDGSRRSKRARS